MLDALAWPAVALILGLVAIAVFRSPISRKIERISRAGKDGVSFERAQEAEPLDNQAESFDHLMKQPISATVLEREKMVVGRLSKLQLKTDAERIALLERVVALNSVELEFTRIAHVIFGSQVMFLVQLAGTRHGLPLADAESAYADAKARFPDFYSERDFAQWLGYLEATNLLHNDNGRLDITQIGTDFLKFLVDARLAYDRYA